VLPIVYATVVVMGLYYAMDKRLSVWEDRMRQHDTIIQESRAAIEAVRAHNNVQDLNFTAFKSSTDVKLDNIEKTTIETYELVKSYTRNNRN
jgi:parvulin-like peptidyl-prolyl isomerase